MLYRSDYNHGGDIYSDEIALDFSSNTNPYGPPDNVLRAMTEAIAITSHYPDPYCREAVEAISRHEGLPSDFILMGSGAAELIYSFCTAIKPVSALETAPTFSEYSAAVKMAGGHIDRHILHRANDFAVEHDIIDSIIRYDPQVLFLCNPGILRQQEYPGRSGRMLS